MIKVNINKIRKTCVEKYQKQTFINYYHINKIRKTCVKKYHKYHNGNIY